MTLEAVGVMTILAGVWCLIIGPRFATYALLNATLLGASAATVLTAFGGANLPPAQLLLLFLGLGLILRPRLLQASLSSLSDFRAGFWLLLTLAYGLMSAIVLPRLFAGTFDVFIVGHSEAGDQSLIAVPLAPVSGNITQSIYFIGDFFCFLIFYAYSHGGGLRTLARAGIICAFVNVIFAGIDLATYWGGVTYTMSFLRNSSYRMLDDAEIAGLKRIVGSFAEASSFAYATLGLLAFTLTLWMKGVYTKSAGAAAFLSVVCLVFTTSTTGYAGLAVMAIWYEALGLAQIIGRRATRNTIIMVVLVPLTIAGLATCLWLSPPLRATAEMVFAKTISSKLESQSGVERGSWNRQAGAAFFGSYGLGAGLGSVRASSWLVAVPASIGVFGSITYCLFIIFSLLPRPPMTTERWTMVQRTAKASGRPLKPAQRHRTTPATYDESEAVIRAACRSASFAYMVASSIAGSFVDLGLPFFLFAGACCGSSLAATGRRALDLGRRHDSVIGPIYAGLELAGE